MGIVYPLDGVGFVNRNPGYPQYMPHYVRWGSPIYGIQQACCGLLGSI